MNIKDISSFEVISSINEQKCITFLLLLFDGRLATASDDSTIKIYSSLTLSMLTHYQRSSFAYFA